MKVNPKDAIIAIGKCSRDAESLGHMLYEMVQEQARVIEDLKAKNTELEKALAAKTEGV